MDCVIEARRRMKEIRERSSVVEVGRVVIVDVVVLLFGFGLGFEVKGAGLMCIDSPRSHSGLALRMVRGLVRRR